MRILIIAFLLTISWCEASKVVLVTGASRGIGLAISKLLAENDYIVYAGVRKFSEEKNPASFRPIMLDVNSQESIDSAVATIMKEEGRIDVLVNNAGIMAYGSLENHTIEEAKAMFEVNFFGVMRMCHAVLPIMRAQKSGSIIQISSRSGFRPLPSLSVYAATKFALEGLSETMATTLKPCNISVSLVEPGPVDTDLDATSPYASRLARDEDPYYAMYKESGLLDPASPDVLQSAEEIALIVKEAIEVDTPLFRYQTTDAIKKQAATRFVDNTGLLSVEEWDPILHNK